jgi:hypothetical protein
MLIFIFSALYRVTQKVFYARQYTSMWAPVVARQISKTIFKLLPRVYQQTNQENQQPRYFQTCSLLF